MDRSLPRKRTNSPPINVPASKRNHKEELSSYAEAERQYLIKIIEDNFKFLDDKYSEPDKPSKLRRPLSIRQKEPENCHSGAARSPQLEETIRSTDGLISWPTRQEPGSINAKNSKMVDHGTQTDLTAQPGFQARDGRILVEEEEEEEAWKSFTDKCFQSSALAAKDFANMESRHETVLMD